MKRRRVPVLLASLFAVFGTFAAVPVPAARGLPIAGSASPPEPSPTPAPSARPRAMPAADSCPITLLAVLPVGAADGTTYAAFISSPDGPGEASGTLWINTPDGAFHVPFKRRGVTNRPYTEALDPIVFRLPKAAALDNVFLDSLDDPQPAPCAIANTWVPGITQNLVPDLLGRLRHTLATAPAPIDATPITDPAAACHSGGAPATVLIAAAPNAPPILDPQQYTRARIYVRVRLAANSAIVSAVADHARGIANNGATVTEEFDSKPFRDVAVAATKRSVFVTETVNCRPRASEYMYIVEFD